MFQVEKEEVPVPAVLHAAQAAQVKAVLGARDNFRDNLAMLRG